MPDDASFSFSPQQVASIRLAKSWLANDTKTQPVFRLFGYAGTGKTTIAKELASSFEGKVCYGAFTGKAALVMRRAGCTGATTIHSLIYKPIDLENGEVSFVRSIDSPLISAKLVIIDECSMVDTDLASDLLSFGVPVLVLGDPAQLPPVSSGGYFTEAEPDAMLTEIHRQSADNPIIRLSTMIREGTPFPLGQYGSSRVIERGILSKQEVLDSDQVLVRRNDTRRAMNVRIRKALGRETLEPVAKDRLVCLRNDKKLGIFNGGLFTCAGIINQRKSPNLFKMLVQSDDFPDRKAQKIAVRKEFFISDPRSLQFNELRGTQQFDYGYVLTVHKAQGSQWPNIIVYDEGGGADHRRWLYTAITRASETVTLVRPI